MKNIFYSLVLFSLLLPSAYPMGFKKYGIGVILGDPTGLSGHYRVNEMNSFDFALAYDLGKDNDLIFHMDFLWDQLARYGIGHEVFGIYGGLGVKLKFKDDTKDDDFFIGPRGLIGTNYKFFRNQAMVFVEAGLAMYVLKSTKADLDLALGFRFYFE